MLAHNGEGLCECGCGTPVANRFSHGHNSRVNHPNFVPLANRFWEKVNKAGPMPTPEAVLVHPEIAGTQCWAWTGSISAKGYGQFNGSGRNVAAHRTSWFLEHGDYPAEQCLHKCDNRNCVRPSHLFEGTNIDNVADCVAKGRNTHPAGEIQGNSKLKTKQVLDIRRLYAEGASAKVLALKF